MYSHTKDKKIKVTNVTNIYEDGRVEKKKWELIDNPAYNGKPRPQFCKEMFPGRKERIPNFQCLENDCPHFGYTEYEEEDNE